MLRQSGIWVLCLYAVCLLFAGGVWWFDRSETIKWVGDTSLIVEFSVRVAESGQPIDGADIHIRSAGGFYDGGYEEDFEKPLMLRTDALGTAYRQCTHNRCIGNQSGLRFTNTYGVYVPNWLVQVVADGYEPSPWLDVNSEYHGKTKHEGPQKDRLTIQIVLKRLVAD